MAYLGQIENDYYQSVSRGDISGQSNKFATGYNTGIDTAAEEDIWFGNGANTFVPPTAARTHNITAGATDTVAGTGARTMLIEGLDTNYLEISETVTLNGAGGVLTANQYRFINRMVVLTVGTAGTNAGNILATAQVDGTLSCAIPAGDARSSNAYYMVPAAKTAFVTQIVASMLNANSNASSSIKLYVKPFPVGATLTPFLFLSEINLNNSGGSSSNLLLKAPYSLPEKSIVKARASVGSNNTRISTTIFLTLVNN